MCAFPHIPTLEHAIRECSTIDVASPTCINCFYGKGRKKLHIVAIVVERTKLAERDNKWLFTHFMQHANRSQKPMEMLKRRKRLDRQDGVVCLFHHVKCKIGHFRRWINNNF